MVKEVVVVKEVVMVLQKKDTTVVAKEEVMDSLQFEIVLWLHFLWPREWV